MKPFLVLLALCALAPAAFSQEEGGETTSTSETSVDADAPSAASPSGALKPMTEAEKIEWYCKKHPEEGEGCRNRALLMLPYISDYAKYENVDTRGQKIEPPKPVQGGGSNNGQLGPLTGAGGPGVSGGKDLVLPYASWATAPHHLHYSRILANYNATGPGTVIALMFKASGGDGLWSWVEDVNSTDNCTYKGWISATPNGPALSGAYCQPQTTNWTGGNSSWTSDPKRSRFSCPLKDGGFYWFNLKLVRWGPNPNANNVYSCMEHITPQGAMSASYFSGK